MRPNGLCAPRLRRGCVQHGSSAACCLIGGGLEVVEGLHGLGIDERENLGGALIRAAERWRSVKVTEFERRQMASVQKELDQEYEAMVDLNVKPSKDEIQVRKSSSSRT
jgi:hypothetical protein